MKSNKLFVVVGFAVVILAASRFEGGTSLSNPLTTSDPTGNLSTFGTSGPVDITNPFFQSLGTNGRTCNSCHVSSAAWSITPAEVQARFGNTKGKDPIFRPVDGANCPSANVSTLAAKKAAYSMLLEKGLIRVSV